MLTYSLWNTVNVCLSYCIWGACDIVKDTQQIQPQEGSTLMKDWTLGCTQQATGMQVVQSSSLQPLLQQSSQPATCSQHTGTEAAYQLLLSTS